MIRKENEGKLGESDGGRDNDDPNEIITGRITAARKIHLLASCGSYDCDFPRSSRETAAV